MIEPQKRAFYPARDGFNLEKLKNIQEKKYIQKNNWHNISGPQPLVCEPVSGRLESVLLTTESVGVLF